MGRGGIFGLVVRTTTPILQYQGLVPGPMALSSCCRGPWETEVMAQVTGFPPPMEETWIEFLALGWGPPRPFWAFGE